MNLEPLLAYSRGSYAAGFTQLLQGCSIRLSYPPYHLFSGYQSSLQVPFFHLGEIKALDIDRVAENSHFRSHPGRMAWGMQGTVRAANRVSGDLLAQRDELIDDAEMEHAS